MNEKVEVFFYKGSGILNKIVSFFTYIKNGKVPKYTHTGFLFQGRRFIFDATISGNCSIRENEYTANDIDTIEIDLTRSQYGSLLLFFVKNKNTKYDIQECIRFIYDFKSDNKNKMNCVETVVDGLNFCRSHNIDSNISMGIDQLYDLLKKKEG